MNIVPRRVSLAQRHQNVGLLIELDLLPEIDDDHLRTRNDLVVNLAAAVELAGADHADDVRAVR